MKPGNEKGHGVLKAYRGPKLRVWKIQVEGPHVSNWPPRGHQLLYGNLQVGELNRDMLAERIRAFARSAFRRPMNADELEPIQSLVAAKLDDGMNPLASLQLGCDIQTFRRAA